MSFNTPIDRRNTHSSKWDLMDKLFGVSPDGGLAMWTADSDYQTAPCVLAAIDRARDHGVFGYGIDSTDYADAITWWMQNRHGWTVDPRLDRHDPGAGQCDRTVAATVVRTGRCRRDLYPRLP